MHICTLHLMPNSISYHSSFSSSTPPHIFASCLPSCLPSCLASWCLSPLISHLSPCPSCLISYFQSLTSSPYLVYQLNMYLFFFKKYICNTFLWVSFKNTGTPNLKNQNRGKVSQNQWQKASLMENNVVRSAESSGKQWHCKVFTC